jgi:hypothetical protein
MSDVGIGTVGALIVLVMVLIIIKIAFLVWLTKDRKQ